MLGKLYFLQIKKIYQKPALAVSMISFYLLYVLLLIKILWFLTKTPVITEASIPVEEYLKFPLVFATSAWIASFFAIFWAIWFMAFLFQDINRNTYSNPHFRKKYIKGKLMLMLTIPIDWTLMALLGGFLIGIHFSHSQYSVPLNQLIALPVQLLEMLSFAFFISVITRSLSQAVAYFIGYFVLEAMIRKVLFSLNLTIGHYLPMKIATRIVEPPSVHFMSNYALNEYLSNNPLPFALNVMLALLYTGIFIFLSIRFLKNKKPNTK